jgi:hypothetical protein
MELAYDLNGNIFIVNNNNYYLITINNDNNLELELINEHMFMENNKKEQITKFPIKNEKTNDKLYQYVVDENKNVIYDNNITYDENDEFYKYDALNKPKFEIYENASMDSNTIKLLDTSLETHSIYNAYVKKNNNIVFSIQAPFLNSYSIIINDLNTISLNIIGSNIQTYNLNDLIFNNDIIKLKLITNKITYEL